MTYDNIKCIAKCLTWNDGAVLLRKSILIKLIAVHILKNFSILGRIKILITLKQKTKHNLFPVLNFSPESNEVLIKISNKANFKHKYKNSINLQNSAKSSREKILSFLPSHCLARELQNSCHGVQNFVLSHASLMIFWWII